MKDLIEALQIFLKYSDLINPTFCKHDTLYIVGVGRVTIPHAKRLAELGFCRGSDCWYSNRFGSA